MEGSLRENLEGAADQISKALGEVDAGMVGNVGSNVMGATKKASGLFDRAKDNIAYILGLPTAIGGAFGFLWESSAEEASLVAQVAQLEEAVADLKAEGDLLGGGTKNWSLDPSAAPGGSITLIIVAAVVVAFIGLLFWYQSKRKRR